MISVEVGVIGVALFGGVEDIDHFASGEVMEVDMGVGIGELTEGLVEMAHGLAEEHGGVFGVRAVGMEFDESPVGATLYGDAGFLPNAEAVDRGGVSAGEVAIFDAREDPVFAALPIEGEGALDDEEFVWAGGLVMGERADGRWAAGEVAIEAPRQTGKNGITEARQLAGLFLLDEPLLIHSAHEFATAEEALNRMEMLIASTPQLSKRLKPGTPVPA